VLIVENGASGGRPSDGDHLRLPENLGFSGGMNAGMKQLLAEGCDRILLLNNDAILEPGCFRRLANALEDPDLAAVGPVILRQTDGRVESRGVSVNLRWGRVRLEGQGEAPPAGGGLLHVRAMSGAAMMMSGAALERVGFLDESYFFSFEDVDWCVRAERAGLRLGVVLDARVRHAGSRTIGRGSADLFYYAARNHLRLLDEHRPLPPVARWARRVTVLGVNLAFALRQTDGPRISAVAGVWHGVSDALRRRTGRRVATSSL
jgi:hypothetical protein